MKNNLNPTVLAFIRDHVDSVVDLELIVLFRKSPARTWSAAEVALELRIDSDWTRDRLTRLCAQGIIKPWSNDEVRYAYAPSIAGFDEAAADMERAYAERRVLVLHLIYTKPQ